MNGLGDHLERASRRFPEPRAGLDDLHARWRRRQRTRRLGAGATALAIFLATAAALGSRLLPGGEREAPPASLGQDLARILPETEATDGLRFVGARDGHGSIIFLVHGDTLARLQRLPLEEGLGREYRSDGTRPFVLVDVFGLRFESETSAQTAFAFLEGDLRRETEAGPSTEFAAPTLGAESVALRNPGNRRFVGSPTVAYLWHRGNFVLGIVAIGSMPRSELIELAASMDERAQGGST